MNDAVVLAFKAVAAVLDANGAGLWATRVPVVVRRERDAQDAADDGTESLWGVPRPQPPLASEGR